MRISPFGPIFGKELRTTSRRKRTYWLRVCYLLALFLFLILAYTSTSMNRYQVVSVAARAQESAELGHAFFLTFAIFSVFAMPLIAPILTATAISAERLGRTLNVLLMTPITSWQVVSGKLFSRLLIALMLLALSLPVLAVVRLLGGVDLDAMFEVMCVCAATALAAAALGLFFSSFMNRAYAVILLSYLTMGFVYGFVPFILALWMAGSRVSSRGGPQRWFFEFLSITNPIAEVMFKVIPGGVRVLGGVAWGWCVLLHLGVAAMLVWATGVMLRRQVRREGERASSVVPESPAASPVLPTAPPSEMSYESPLIITHPAKKTREIGDNPVLWRELRRPLFTKKWQSIVGGFVTVALMGLTYIMLANQWRNELGEVDSHVGYASVFCAVMTLLICVVSATSITSEKESDTWTLLLATPLGARAIVWGKVGGVLRRLMWPSILIASHFFVFTVSGVLSWTSLGLVLWVLFTFNVMWIVTGLYYSLRLKNNTFAVVANLLTPLVFYAGIPVVMMIVGNVVLDRRADRAAEWTMIYMPYSYLAFGMSGMPGKQTWTWDSAVHQLWLPYSNGGVTPLQYVAVTISVGLIQLGIAAGLLMGLIRRFNLLVGRATQVKIPTSAPVVFVRGTTSSGL